MTYTDLAMSCTHVFIGEFDSTSELPEPTADNPRAVIDHDLVGVTKGSLKGAVYVRHGGVWDCIRDPE